MLNFIFIKNSENLMARLLTLLHQNLLLRLKRDNIFRVTFTQSKIFSTFVLLSRRNLLLTFAHFAILLQLKKGLKESLKDIWWGMEDQFYGIKPQIIQMKSS